MTPEEQSDNLAFLGFDIAKLEQTTTPQPVFIDLDHIDPYDGNSRLVANAKREELRAITLRDGAPPGYIGVTRRPGSARLVLSRGGNTRLEIVKELRREHPDDPRWRKILVWFEPFIGELQLAANAYQENEARGELLFIERARAFCRLYELWAAMERGRPTIQAFLKYFDANLGKAPSATIASRMQYAVDTLYPVIPTPLVAGQMTDYAVRQLVDYRNKVCDLWVTARFGPPDEFETYFYQHLQRQEKELAATAVRLAEEEADEEFTRSTLQIDYDRLNAALAHEMACVEHVVVREAVIAEWIEAVLTGTPVEYIAAAEPADGSPPDTEFLDALRLQAASSTPRIEWDTPDISDKIRADNERKRQEALRKTLAPASPAPPAHVLQDYRDSACRAAQRIAARHRFAPLVIPYRYGIGYVIADILVQGNDEPVPLSRAAPWWVLVSCGLILDLPPKIANHMLPEDSLLRASLEGRQQELLSHVMGPSWAIGRYLAALDDMDNQDFLVLLNLTREIIRVCGHEGFPWAEAPSTVSG